MSGSRREALMQEAIEIFLQMRDEPENRATQARRDEFISQSEEHKDVYDHVLKTWKASGVARASKVLRSVVLIFFGLIGAGALAYDSIRIAVLADLYTRGTPQKATLVSGDFAFLDAGSALVDETDGANREIELLEGAAFFTVESETRAFTVTVGEVLITVVGTEFETAFVDGTVMVSVAEGTVDVDLPGETLRLQAGAQLKWSDDLGAMIETREIASLATWRTERLSVDGLTLGQAAAILERRIAGPIVFTDNAIRNSVVSGNIDLSKPLAALRILAQTGGGKLIHVPGVGRMVIRD